MSPNLGRFSTTVALLALPLSAFAQAPAAGLSGVQGGQGGQGGIFTIPYVAAHTLGIPGVTRPMLMAGPMGGFGGAGGGLGGGGVGGPMVNPNWVGAAGMFMPHLLTGNGAVGGGASGGTATGGRTVGGFGSTREVPTQQGLASSAVGAPGETASGSAVDASATRSPAFATTRPAVIVHAAPVDPAVVEERLLAYQKEQAAKGSPSAQLALARRYSKGQGVEANPAVARVWLEAAARSGSEEAQAELASK